MLGVLVLAVQNHHELVAAKAGHGVRFAHAGIQPFGDFFEQDITGLVSLGVVQ